MNAEAQPLSHVERLIEFYARELHVEIVINKDSTGFWKCAMDDILGMRLTSFREGIVEFVKRLGDEGDMFNYFSAFCLRVYSQPYSQLAVDVFCAGFDEVSSDPMLKSGYNYKAKDLSPLSRLLLFLTVHRNEVYIALAQRTAEEEKARLPKQSSRR